MENSKKILIISHDPDFSEKVLESLKVTEADIILAKGLREGGDILEKENIDRAIIEYPVSCDSTVLSGFLSRPVLKQIRVLLAAKEKKFLSDFSGENILKSSFDEINVGVQKLLENF